MIAYVSSEPWLRLLCKHLLQEKLREKGAPLTCYVLSKNSKIDGLRLPLCEALIETVGYGFGTFLSCIPGRLAYYEGQESVIFVRDN